MYINFYQYYNTMKLIIIFICTLVLLYYLRYYFKKDNSEINININEEQFQTLCDKKLTYQSDNYILWNNNNEIVMKFNNYNDYMKYYNDTRPHFLRKGINCKPLNVSKAAIVSSNPLDSNWFDRNIYKKWFNIEYFDNYREKSCNNMDEKTCGNSDSCGWCVNNKDGTDTGKCVKGNYDGPFNNNVCNSRYSYKNKCVYGDSNNFKDFKCDKLSNSSNTHNNIDSNINSNCVSCSDIDIKRNDDNDNIGNTNLKSILKSCKLNENDRKIYNDWLLKLKGTTYTIQCNNSSIKLIIKKVSDGHYAGNSYIINIPDLQTPFTKDLKMFLCTYAKSNDEIYWLPNKLSKSGGTVVILNENSSAVKLQFDNNGYPVIGTFENNLKETDSVSDYAPRDKKYTENNLTDEQKKQNCKMYCDDVPGELRKCNNDCRKWGCANCKEDYIPISTNNTIIGEESSNVVETSSIHNTSNRAVSKSIEQDHTNSSGSQNNSTSKDNDINNTTNVYRRPSDGQTELNQTTSNNDYKPLLIDKSDHMEPDEKIAASYGWSMIPPHFWSVPQQRPPSCIPQKEHKATVTSIYDKSEPLNALDLTEGGSIMPKFEYKEVYNPKYYYPGWKTK